MCACALQSSGPEFQPARAAGPHPPDTDPLPGVLPCPPHPDLRSPCESNTSVRFLRLPHCWVSDIPLRSSLSCRWLRQTRFECAFPPFPTRPKIESSQALTSTPANPLLVQHPTDPPSHPPGVGHGRQRHPQLCRAARRPSQASVCAPPAANLPPVAHPPAFSR